MKFTQKMLFVSMISMFTGFAEGAQVSIDKVGEVNATELCTFYSSEPYSIFDKEEGCWKHYDRSPNYDQREYKDDQLNNYKVTLVSASTTGELTITEKEDQIKVDEADGKLKVESENGVLEVKSENLGTTALKYVLEEDANSSSEKEQRADIKNTPEQQAYNFIKRLKFFLILPDPKVEAIDRECQDNFSKVIRAIRQTIFAIADNPIGFKLLERLCKANSFNIVIGNEYVNNKNENESMEFITEGMTVYMPMISFVNEPQKADRQDLEVLSLHKENIGESKLILNQTRRPYYVGIVHEFIHILHRLEMTVARGGIPNDLGRTTLWNDKLDDCYTITGIKNEYKHVKKNEKEKEIWETIENPVSEEVCEFLFRYHEGLPIRFSYPVKTRNQTYDAAMERMKTMVNGHRKKKNKSALDDYVKFMFQKHGVQY